MEIYGSYFKALAIAHGVVGFIVICFILVEEIQKSVFYNNVNPLAGDIHKYLSYFTYGALTACGYLVFYSYKIALIAAWVSTSLFVATKLIVPLVQNRVPNLSRSFVINLCIRTLAAAALTYLYRELPRS